jgi:hypothetical protein
MGRRQDHAEEIRQNRSRTAARCQARLIAKWFSGNHTAAWAGRAVSKGIVQLTWHPLVNRVACLRDILSHNSMAVQLFVGALRWQVSLEPSHIVQIAMQLRSVLDTLIIVDNATRPRSNRQ